MANDNSAPQGWMSDVQRALALILIVTFALSTFFSVTRVVWWGEASDVLELAKTLQSALVNMGLIALGFFFGNTVAQRQTNEGQQKILEKLAPTPPAAPSAPTPWWTLLTDDEKNLIVAKAQGLGGAVPDPRVAAFITAAQIGSANADDLSHLVSVGLLTQARADAIKAVD